MILRCIFQKRIMLKGYEGSMWKVKFSLRFLYESMILICEFDSLGLGCRVFFLEIYLRISLFLLICKGGIFTMQIMLHIGLEQNTLMDSLIPSLYMGSIIFMILGLTELYIMDL